MFTVGLGKMMENTKKDDTHTMSKCHKRREKQKGIWKFHPQGVKRPVNVSRWSRRRDKGEIDNFWARYGLYSTQSSIRYDLPSAQSSTFSKWGSEYNWEPLLDPDYSGIFDENCNQYSYYLDIIKESFGTNDGELFLFPSEIINHHCTHCFTALEEDLFAPKRFYTDNGDIPVVFDSGCTVSIIPYKDDFVGTITNVKKTITGLSSTVEVEREGTVLWSFYDDYGVIQHIQVHAYYIPASPVRLFSPQHYFRQEKGGNFRLDADGCVFTFASNKTLTCIYSKESHLPIALATKRNVMSKSKCSGQAYLTAASSGKLNISKAQEELLLLHEILGHYDIADTQRLMFGK